MLDPQQVQWSGTRQTPTVQFSHSVVCEGLPVLVRFQAAKKKKKKKKGVIKMNLISCQNCGCVLDKDRIIMPDTHNHDTQETIEGNVRWSSDAQDYRPIIDCPTCNSIIFYQTGNIAY